MTMKCPNPNCNETEHEPSAKFCHACGMPLKSVNAQRPIRTQTFRHFEWAESFSEGMAMVTVNGKTGFIDKSGTMVIEPRFNQERGYGFGRDMHWGFSEGLAVVSTGQYPNRKYGCINHLGDFVIEPEYDMIWPFSEGLAPVWTGGKWGFIDKTGIMVIQPQYDSVGGFSESLAVVELGYQNYGYIDKFGRVVLQQSNNLFRKSKFIFASDFHDGFARVECDGKQGFIDKSGKLFKSKHYSIEDFSEGFAAFSNSGNCGFIDNKLKTAIKLDFYNKSKSFHDGMAAVEKMFGMWGYINTTGELVIPCQFQMAGDFSDGLAAVNLTWMGKVGFVDKQGNMVIKPRFSEVSKGFSEGLAAVVENGKWGFIDKTGNYSF